MRKSLHLTEDELDSFTTSSKAKNSRYDKTVSVTISISSKILETS